MAYVPGPNPKVRPPTRLRNPTSRSEVMSFRSPVVRNLLIARHVVLGRRPDEVVLKATGSRTGLVKDRARRGRRTTRVLGPRRPRGRREVLASLVRWPGTTRVRRPKRGPGQPEERQRGSSRRDGEDS